MKRFAIVEKTNRLAVHGLFETRERAEQFLRDTMPLFVARGYYMDKNLTAESFCVVKRNSE